MLCDVDSLRKVVAVSSGSLGMANTCRALHTVVCCCVSGHADGVSSDILGAATPKPI